MIFRILFLMLFLLPQLPAQDSLSQFPKLTAETLNRQVITFPDDLEQEINILILVFEQQAQRIVNTWADLILSELEPLDFVAYYEVPMISRWYKPISWQIDNWMRGGIPSQYHPNTATFYGNRKPYFQALDMTEKSSCYIFVVDRDGLIRFRSEGKRTPAKEKAFRKVLHTMNAQIEL
jgi:hypothetical protein